MQNLERTGMLVINFKLQAEIETGLVNDCSTNGYSGLIVD